MEFLISIIWFLLPAGFSNMSPVLFKKINFLNKPVDFGKKWFDGKFIFGKNKTYRGFFFGTLVAIFVLYLQVLVYPEMKNFSFFDYSQVNIFLLGFLFGFGALLGDLIESFLKRRVGVESGQSWMPWDQIDWVLGALILTYPILKLDWKIYLFSILIWGILHPVVNLIGYWLKIKKNKF